jgi:cytochrome b6-f complex iron-sulfur subunit
MGRRQFMNLLTFGTITGTALGALYPVVKYFIPPSSGASGGGVTAKDALGNDVIVSDFLNSHAVGDRVLTQGLKGDPTYVVVESEGEIASFGLNAVCTHLGCVVPWNAAENKFMCPCHGSQYNNQGKVVRGPAPLSLALVHADVTEDGKIALTPWTETDFRTGEDPWWA